MQLEHTFTVPAPVGQAWTTLLDVPRVAPCMPGATLTGFDGATFTGTVKVKLGPVTMTYRGSGRFTERDETARRVVIEATGKETRGSGTARATITASLAPDGGATRVVVTTDLAVTGRPAQFGRGMLADVGGKLIGQFADCLATTLAAPAEPAEPDEPAESPAGDRTSAAERADRSPSGAAGPEQADRAALAARLDQAEPIDLLDVSGAGAALRRAAPYAAAFAAGGLVVWLLTGRRR